MEAEWDAVGCVSSPRHVAPVFGPAPIWLDKL